MEQQRLLIVPILQHNSRKDLSSEELYLANVVLLESRRSLTDPLVILQGLAVKLLVALRSVKPAAELKRLLLIFRPVLPEHRNFRLFHKDSSCRGAGSVV